MEYGNTAVVFMVVGVSAAVLALAFVGMYCLNKIVDRNAH
jgi:hypothetical protein